MLKNNFSTQSADFAHFHPHYPDVGGYLVTWSLAQHFQNQNGGDDPLNFIREALRKLLGVGNK